MLCSDKLHNILERKTLFSDASSNTADDSKAVRS